MKTRYLRLVKKQRGFTLIELLAVILILGIIALIAIPTVNSVIEQSRKGSVEASAKQYIKSFEEFYITSSIGGNELENRTYTVEDISGMDIGIKGTKPDSGTLKLENGNVVKAFLTYGNYIYECTNETCETTVKGNSKFVLENDQNSNGNPDVGDKVCLETECFYVISVVNDDIRMLAEWNLNVGYDILKAGSTTYYGSLNGALYDAEKETIIWTKIDNGPNDVTYENIAPEASLIRQDSTRKGHVVDKSAKIIEAKGIINFTSISKANFDNDNFDGYWANGDTTYPKYVYNEKSTLYKYINSYVENLNRMTKANIKSGDLIKYEEILDLGCNESTSKCPTSKPWIYQTNYWTGSAYDASNVIIVETDNIFYDFYYYYADLYGVRPVITIPKSAL